MRLPQLPRPSRPKFLRRKCSDDGNDVDLEAQAHPLPGTVVCSSSATTSASASASASAVDEKGHDHSASMHFRGQQHLDAELPSYDAIVAAARRSSRDTQRSGRERLDVEEDEAQPRPSISVRPPFHGDQENPTILVLFKEDYAWARAYLKDMDYRVALRRALRRHLYKWYALIIIIVTISALVSAKHTTIVDFCKPVTQRIRSWPGGWLIPIALLIIVSFPPLVGHEIIGILCGLVWGIGEGFGILCAGTFFGELATWYAFKGLCSGRAKKYEQRNKLYASLTQLIREKSFTFVLVLRFSAVPGHITTAVSASAGANIWSYCAAAILTLPKQLVIVYLGSSFGTHSQKNTIISWAATIATFIGTVVAAVYIYYHMRMLIRRGDVHTLPAMTDPRNSAEWADLPVHGARGVGAGLRLEMDGGAGRKSVDVVFGPHARAAQQQQMRSPLRKANRPRALTRTRSLPGPITEEEMRSWLTSMDTPLMTHTMAMAPPQVRVVSPPPPVDSKFDDDLADAGPSTSRATNGDLEPIPYASAILLSPPAAAAGSRPESPQPIMLLPELAHEHIALSHSPTQDNGNSPAGSRPVSGAVPAILLTPTYTPARSRADSLRGTVSLDIERPLVGGREIEADADAYAVDHGARTRPRTRARGDSSAAMLGWHRPVSSQFEIPKRRRGESSAATLGRPVDAVVEVKKREVDVEEEKEDEKTMQVTEGVVDEKTADV